MWQQGALLSNGNYMSIKHNEKIVHITSPYDDEILQLNIKLNKTYIPYGIHGKEKLKKQANQDYNASIYGAGNEVNRTVSKSSDFYKNSSWDLVDAEKAQNDFDFNNINKKMLPKHLQQMSEKELKSYVLEQGENRKKIQERIQLLNTERKKFFSKKKSIKNKTLENAMITSIKKQAKKKNYIW